MTTGDQAHETSAEALPHLRADDVGYLDVGPEQREIMLPVTGEIVKADDEDALIRALAFVRDVGEQVKDAKRELTELILERSRILGSKTITLADGRKGVIGGETETTYDAAEIERELREAGMPESRIREIVVETVTHTVVAAEAKKAAGANPVYAEIIARHKTTREKSAYISLKGFGG